MSRRCYGPDKAAVEQAKRERKEAKRRKQKDARDVGPVKYGVTYGDTGSTTEKELTNGGS
jgi:hypothetical protein